MGSLAWDFTKTNIWGNYRFLQLCLFFGSCLAVSAAPVDWNAVSIETQLLVLVPVTVLLGVPHGALDTIVVMHLIPASIQGTVLHLVFHSAYVGVMVATALCWQWYPFAAMKFFLIMSVYHFGQCDHEWWHLWEGRKSPCAVVVEVLSIIARGGCFLIAVSQNPKQVALVFAYILDTDSENDLFQLLEFCESFRLLHLICFVAAVIVLSLGFGGRSNRQSTTAEDHNKDHQVTSLHQGVMWTDVRFWSVVELLVAYRVFQVLPPLVSFGLYFNLCHSLRHLTRVCELEGGPPGQTSKFKFGITTILTLIAVAWASTLLPADYLTLHLVRPLFVGLSCMTNPHLLVVESFYDGLGARVCKWWRW